LKVWFIHRIEYSIVDMIDDIGSLKASLDNRLDNIDKGRIVFVGVGNRLRGDDGIGPALIDLLKDRVPNAIDSGYAPENYTSAIKRLKPAAIIFIDAVKFDSYPPGYARVLDMSDVEQRRISVHNFSLDVIMGYLKEETGADVFMIGVQPKKIEDGERLSPVVAGALKEIEEAILRSIEH
jgi:hydrogenase 3 maturation protease